MQLAVKKLKTKTTKKRCLSGRRSKRSTNPLRRLRSGFNGVNKCRKNQIKGLSTEKKYRGPMKRATKENTIKVRSGLRTRGNASSKALLRFPTFLVVSILVHPLRQDQTCVSAPGRGSARPLQMRVVLLPLPKRKGGTCVFAKSNEPCCYRRKYRRLHPSRTSRWTFSRRAEQARQRISTIELTGLRKREFAE